MIENHQTIITIEKTTLQVGFTSKLKVQLALYRSSKASKTEPMQFTFNGSNLVTIEKVLTLQTTMQFHQEMRTYIEKDVQLQVALDIDGNKEILIQKVLLNQYLQQPSHDIHTNHKLFKAKETLIIKQHPKIVLFFTIIISIKKPESQEKHEQTAFFNQISFNDKKNKKIRFEDQLERQKFIQNVEQGNPISSKSRQKVKMKSENISTSISMRNIQQELQNCKKIIKNHQNQLHQLQDEIKKKDFMMTEQNIKINQLSSKCKDYNQNLIEKQNSHQKQLENITKRSNKTINLNEDQKQKQNLRKFNQIKNKYDEMQKKYKQECRNTLKLQEQISQLQKNNEKLLEQKQKYLQNIKSNNCNNLSNNDCKMILMQNQLKKTKQLLKQSQRNSHQYKKQINSLECINKDLEQIIKQSKNKIYQFDKQNLELTTEKEQLTNKFQRIIAEKEQSIQELTAEIEQMQDRLKNKTGNQSKGGENIYSMRNIGGESATQLKKKVENLEKQLQKKQKLLKEIMRMKKQSEAEKMEENCNYKNEIISLKEIIDNFSSKNISLSSKRITEKHIQSDHEITDIESKILIQKIKKQLEQAKRNEKNLLIEKTQLESRNKNLQDDMIKNKQNIANILNAVQDSGNQKLISEVYSIIE